MDRQAMEQIPKVGSTLGHYRLTELLGRGGMGVVFRAEDVRLARDVALKLLAGEVSDDARFRRRFLRESQLAASTEHPGILPIYEAGEIDGLLYMAMRYVEGSDLGRLLRAEGPLEPERAVELVGQLADALDAAHARGLVHRDVKPSNALIGRAGGRERVYLVDFGITEDVRSPERLTESGQLVGTGGYLAPERIRGDPVDGRADVYSLGCVLFECLTGEVPFPRSSGVAEIYAHLEDDPPRVSERRPGLSVEVDAVVVRALAKEPDDRWQTCSELAEAARAALRPPPTDTPVPARSRGRPLPRRALVAAVAVAALIAVAAIAALSRPDDGPSLAGLAENTVGRIDPGAMKITTQARVGSGPIALAVGAGAVWSLNSGDSTVTRIDDDGGKTAIPVGDDSSGIAFGEGFIWVTERQNGTLSQISPQSNRIVNTILVGNSPAAVAVADGAVWVASDAGRDVKRVDIASGSVSAEVPLGASPSAIAAGRDALWVASEEAGTVFRIEPHGGVVANTVTVGDGPVALAAGAGAVWVANRQDATVSRIDPASDTVTDRIPVGRGPTAIAAGEDGIWVANGGDGTLTRIDPTTRRPARTLSVRSRPTALAVADGSVWAAAVAPASSHRGGTLRVEARPYHWKRLEPAAYDADVDQLLSLMYGGLVSYRRAGGASYGSLVGDLATGVPKPSPDGRTYVFRLRRGVRFSNGALVKPEDFRVSIETFLRDHGRSFMPRFFDSILGARECAQRPKRCDLSKGIVTDAAAGTITLHLSRPDPDLMHALAYMFAYVAPAEHPFGGSEQPPGTGPYKLVSFDRRRGAHLVRNPYFRVYSPDAQPAGAADEIVVRVRPLDQLDAQVGAVERGDSDVIVAHNIWGFAGLSPAKLSALITRNAGRVSTDAAPLLEFMWLNVREPPFDDANVRRAVNYAVDRDRIETLAGGANIAQATCQLVPTGFPSYKPSCPYTRRPGRGGDWNGPDVARARRLIARSGTKGMKVTVWTYDEKRAFGAYFRSLLQRLGYRSALHVAPSFPEHMKAVLDRRNHAQIGILAFLADIGVASNFAEQWTCDSGEHVGWNPTRFCDPEIDAMAAAARRATGTEADALWTKVYERIMAAAPAVPLVNRREVTLVSRRVGNFQHHPMFEALLDQLWVR